MKRVYEGGKITSAILCRSTLKAVLLRVRLQLAHIPCVGVFSTREALLRAMEQMPVELIFAEDELLKTSLTNFSKRVPTQTAIVLIGDEGDQNLAIEAFSTGNTIDYMVSPIKQGRIQETKARWCTYMGGEHVRGRRSA